MTLIHKVMFGLVVVLVLMGGGWYFLHYGNEVQSPTTQVPADTQAHIDSKSGLVVLESPKPLSEITSPLTVTGKARGYWFFEASFPITLVDWDGKIIAQSHAEAVLDPNNPESTWMTEDFVPFTGTITFDVPPGYIHRGALILQKDNPSGMPEHDDALEIPITYPEAK